MFARPKTFCKPRLFCKDGSRTHQEFLKDSLIGSILKRFEVSGVLDQPNARRAMIYGDELPSDFTEGMNAVTANRSYDEKDGVAVPVYSDLDSDEEKAFASTRTMPEPDVTKEVPKDGSEDSGNS